jgi:hypothetical protein
MAPQQITYTWDYIWKAHAQSKNKTEINLSDYDNKKALSILRTRLNTRTFVLVAMIGSEI